MLFNSYIFIFLFLPLALLGWYGLNYAGKYRAASLFLAAMSLWFYAYFNVGYLALIAASIALNYLLSFLLTRLPDTGLCRRSVLSAGIVLNLGILFYFKYYDFFVENINRAFNADFTLKHILLPLGISFFTFQQLSFVIDRCLGRCRHYPFLDYVTFVTFFPQLIAGPIVLHSELIPQFEDVSRRRFDAASFAGGISLFVLGLAKKVLLADTFALMANYGFSQPYYLDTPATVVTVLAYTFELYFDFSGYSDMAIGLGRMFHIELPVNFDSPYRSHSIKEFWRRWHITLSRFFLNYVYIPLGGSRRGLARTLLNTFLVFLLSGLWHGAAWTYVAWGAMHGILVVCGALLANGRAHSETPDGTRPARFRLPAWIKWLGTFTLVSLAWIFFRSPGMDAALRMFQNLAALSNTGKVWDIAAQLQISEIYALRQALEMVSPAYTAYLYMAVMLLLFALAFRLIFRPNAYERTRDGALTSKRCWLLSILFVWCIVSLSHVSTFLYFNF